MRYFLTVASIAMASMLALSSAAAKPPVYNPDRPLGDSRLGPRDGSSRVLTGPRAELRLGYDSFEVSDPIAGNVDEDGALWGFSFGYDHAINRIIIGAFTSVEWSSTSFAGGVDTGRDVEVGAKFGYAVRDNLSLYTLIALVNSQLTGGGLEAFDDGYRIGFGGEYSFGNNLFAKLEYRYTDYDDDAERHQVVTAVGKKF